MNPLKQKLSRLRSYYRSVGLNQRIRWKFRKTSLPQLALGFGHAPGDDLMLTALVRALRTTGQPNSCWVFSNFPELFENNPSVSQVHPFDDEEPRQWQNLNGIPYHQCEYTTGSRVTDTFSIPQRHLVAEMAYRLGISGNIDVTPELFLNKTESESMQWAKDCIVISPSGLAKRLPMTNKEWYFTRFQEVRNFFEKITFIQIGDAGDPLLEKTHDYRGKLTIKQSAYLLANACGFLGQVGFQMHLARAVSCPGVIIYGGREKPWQSGYNTNINIATNPPCSPCWRYNTCEYDHKCMAAITTAQVTEALTKLLDSNPDRPAAPEFVPI